MLFQKNDHIGAYTVTFPHKQGAYAETYRVKDAAGKTRFLKLISYGKLERGQLDDNGRVVEVKLTKTFNHRNLCRYVDSGNQMRDGGQQAFLVTEFVSGETLAAKIARDGLPSVYEIKRIAQAVLSALGWLHAQDTPIIHGNVTTANVLLSLTGEWDDLKLIGFGHAHRLDAPPVKPNLDRLNAFTLAPECFSGVSQVQSDLYALGAMMYQMLYGELPWFFDLSRVSKEGRVDAILAARDKELDAPLTDKFELDEQLVNTICKALAYEVEDRFQTADEFIKAIDGEVKVSRPVQRRREQSKPKTKNDEKSFSSGIMKGPGFKAVAGMEELKALLREEIIETLQHPDEVKSYGLTIPNGMLLYGPPGCGKTFFAKRFAEEVGFNFMCITPATLKSKWVNATQENIAQMFKEAEANAPTIIFIDEFNELVPSRQSSVHEMSKSAVNEMLAQMDRTGERGIFVIGATNTPDQIDPAILRAGRLDKKYYVGVPDREARAALFKLYLERIDRRDFGLDYDELASLTANYVSADIDLIVKQASRTAYKQQSRVTMDLLREAIRDVRPSVSAEELRRYEKIRATVMGEKSKNDRPRIGF